MDETSFLFNPVHSDVVFSFCVCACFVCGSVVRLCTSLNGSGILTFFFFSFLTSQTPDALVGSRHGFSFSFGFQRLKPFSTATLFCFLPTRPSGSASPVTLPVDDTMICLLQMLRNISSLCKNPRSDKTNTPKLFQHQGRVHRGE